MKVDKMSRHPREYSKAGVYHVMLRGNERKNIIIDHYDKEKFINTIFKVKKNNVFKLYAYCIMSNHVHLIIKEEKEQISDIMKKIAVSYAYYFNCKYKRVGHVFQDRFKSEAIENEAYLLSVIRYVHNNPEKAEICRKETYSWSSYHNYVEISAKKAILPEVKEILELFSDDKIKGVQEFIHFSNEKDKKNFLELDEKKKLEVNEGNVKEYINGYLKLKNLRKEDLNKKEYKRQREDLIKQLIRKSSLSKRRIAFFSGTNREIVRKMSVEPSP
ncbi:MAG: transposase [Candidatus Caldatribacteriota bacterium]|nr:transposase [Candidatus Caldatribacteriota bacterium]